MARSQSISIRRRVTSCAREKVRSRSFDVRLLRPLGHSGVLLEVIRGSQSYFMTSHLGSGQNLAESLNKIHNGWMEPSDYMDFLFQGSLSEIVSRPSHGRVWLMIDMRGRSWALMDLLGWGDGHCHCNTWFLKTLRKNVCKSDMEPEHPFKKWRFRLWTFQVSF